MTVSALTSSLSGMMAASRRLDVAASNIANVRTTGPVPDEAGNTTAYRPLFVSQSESAAGVSVEVRPRTPAFTIEADPQSPDADGRGLVAAPAVDLSTELTDVMKASFTYSASAKVMSVVRDMSRTTVDMLA